LWPRFERKKPMTRNEWKAAYGKARKAARGRDGLINLGFAYWTMINDQRQGRSLHPAIIRDRSTSSRVADSLAWAAEYRQAAKRYLRSSYHAFQVAAHKAGSRACIAESRQIRASQSAFHTLP
jgi:hypothetical protein